MLYHTAHGNGRHNMGGNIGALKGITHCQGIHHRGQHTHMVARHPIHASGIQSRPAEQIATTDNQPYLHANAHKLTNFKSHAIQNLGVNPKALFTHQLLTT